MDGYYQLLEAITGRTDSSLILFFVILAALVLPLYGLPLRDRKYARQHEKDVQEHHSARERVILDVVKDNSAAITACSTVLDSTKQTIDRMHDRLDGVLAARTG